MFFFLVSLNEYQGSGVEINVTKSSSPLDTQCNINVVENPKNYFVEEVVKLDITQQNSTVEKELNNLKNILVDNNKSLLNQELNCFPEFCNSQNSGEQFPCRGMYDEKKNVNNSCDSSSNTLLVLDNFNLTTINKITNLEKKKKSFLNDNYSLNEEKIVEITNLDASDSQLYGIEVEDSKEFTKAARYYFDLCVFIHISDYI